MRLGLISVQEHVVRAVLAPLSPPGYMGDSDESTSAAFGSHCCSSIVCMHHSKISESPLPTVKIRANAGGIASHLTPPAA